MTELSGSQKNDLDWMISAETEQPGLRIAAGRNGNLEKIIILAVLKAVPEGRLLLYHN